MNNTGNIENNVYCISVVTFLFTIASGSIYAQNLENLGSKDPIKINGGISATQILYRSDGISNRRDPYSYFLTGNINLNLYGWSVPFSFAFSNQNKSFTQPFNQFGLHPTYKWATAHLGYASMNFSPYTLSGHIFRGAGIDLSPGKFHFAAMYGNLQRAIAWDSLNTNRPAFKRDGFGFKTGYRDGNDYAEVSLFHGSDDKYSIPSIPMDNSLLPEENLVIGFSLGKALFEKIILTTELATSGITRDTQIEKAGNVFPFSNLGFDSKESTSFHQAFKGGVNYKEELYTIGLGYERIDPGYRTHGAYYFNNDLENYTLNASTTLLESKLNLSASGGLQHDNLDKSKISTMNRLVASFNAAFAPTAKLSFNLNYSNFQSYTNIRSQFVNINQLTPYDNLDTLKFTQLTQSINGGFNYLLGNSSANKQFVSATISIQDAAEHQSQVEQNSGSRFLNVNTSYSINIIPSGLTMSLSYNANQNKGIANDLITHGPSASINKSLLERRLRLTIGSAWNNTLSEGRTINQIINMRTNAAYVLAKKHNFNLGVIAVNRKSKATESAVSFTEYTGTLTYSYSF